MHPVKVFDYLTFSRGGVGIQLSCSEPSLPIDSGNLVYRAAAAFLLQSQITDGVKIVLEKNLPLAAGLGGGSGNAAVTLLGLNELFGNPLSAGELQAIAASLGSDIPFFLQNNPALATGRGEEIQSLEPFPALQGWAFLLIHPGFGISTAWAYQTLGKYPSALNGQSGRAAKLVTELRTTNLRMAVLQLYNSLEAPALHKYPVLVLLQQFLREQGAAATLMSGSGSTTFALVDGMPTAENLAERVKEKFGAACWTAAVPI
jgi:4-diphosphocytidyl-2-C-methyl-D-erythritol kinase